MTFERYNIYYIIHELIHVVTIQDCTLIPSLKRCQQHENIFFRCSKERRGLGAGAIK